MAVSLVLAAARSCRKELSDDGLPRYVAGWCSLARHGSMKSGYQDVGYLIASRLAVFRPPYLDSCQWSCRIDVLGTQVHAKHRASIKQWCLTNYPSLMARIPKRQHGSFLAGFVEQCVEQVAAKGSGVTCVRPHERPLD